MKMIFCALAAVLALSACGDGNDPVANEANEVAGLPDIAVPASDPSGAPPANLVNQSVVMPAKAVAAIPAAMHGRWGLTPADCTSTRGDAKGLLIVSAGDLKFFESRAIPSGNVSTTKDSFNADFAFTGEGQQWRKFQTLQLHRGNLQRTESSPMASYTYVRCT